MHRFVPTAVAAAAVFSSSTTAQQQEKCGDYYLDEANQMVYRSQECFYRNRRTWYFDFDGPRSANNGTDDNPASVVGTAPIYLVRRANGDAAGSNIIDVLPCEDGYSDLWQVFVLTVPDDYEPDTFKSFQDVNEAVSQNPDDYQLDAADPPTYVNCPVVPPGSTLEDTSPGEVDVGQWPLVVGFYKNQSVAYFDFGPVNKTETEPVWVLKTDTAEEPDGLQNNIIDTIPEDENNKPDPDQPEYTPFWQMVVVNVPENKTSALSSEPITAASDVPSDYQQDRMPAIVNCPVTFTTEELVEPGGKGDDGNSAEGLKVGFVALGALLVAML